MRAIFKLLLSHTDIGLSPVMLVPCNIMWYPVQNQVRRRNATAATDVTTYLLFT